MTTTYVRLADTDKPESQTAITASFVDENGKHIDIGGGGTAEIHTDDTLAGTGTTGNPLKLSDATSQKIEKAETITEDNLLNNHNVDVSSGSVEFSNCAISKDSRGHLCVIPSAFSGLGCYHDSSMDADVLIARKATSTIRGTVSIGENIEVDSNSKISVPAITAIKNVPTLDSSASLSDVINKINEILNAVKNTVITVSDETITDPTITDPGQQEPTIGDSE